MASKLTEFKEQTILPLLLKTGYITRAFPSYNFKDRGKIWVTPYHVNGELSKGSTDQSYIYKNGDTLCDNNQGDKVGIIELYQSLNNLDFIQALKELSRICGVEYQFPAFDEVEERKSRDLQEKRKKAQKGFVSALWSGEEEPTRVLNYLRNTRKWTDEQIKEEGLGYADSELIKLLPVEDTHKEGTLSKSLGTSHRLTFPIKGASTLYGFKFRNIDYSKSEAEKAKEEGRYYAPKYLNTYSLPRNADFFGIPVSAEEITVVEGEADAAHARSVGAEGVVAAGGKATESQIKAAVQRGVKRFNLLYDNDEKGRSFIAPTVEVIEGLGADAYIAYFPDEIKDADDFLATHTLEEWNSLISEAVPACLFKLDGIVDKYRAQEEDQGLLKYKQEDGFYREILSLVNSPRTKPHQREEIFRDLENKAFFNVEEFRAYADQEFNRSQANQRSEATKGAATKINGLLNAGKVDEALKEMRDTAAALGAQERTAEYARIFAPLPAGALDNYLAAIPAGIPTGITFKDGKNETKLTLNPGLTFICGYRGHCKTSFLNNIALNEAQRNIKFGTGKSVLYFSYEIDKRRLLADLLNTFVNDPEMQTNPIDAIHSHFRGNGGKYFKAGHYEPFLKKKDEYEHFYLASGALRIIDESYKVERLLDAIRYYLTLSRPSIICIDYAQLLYSEDYSRLRTEEIKKVVNDIKDFANKEGLPIVLAAQFNREVFSPVSVDTRNIGEGGDFERIADTCIGLFNLKELRSLAGTKAAQEEEKEARRILNSLLRQRNESEMEDFSKEERSKVEGKLFVRLMKRRYGYYPLDTLLDWEGKTKRITVNDEKELERRPGEEPPPPPPASSDPTSTGGELFAF